MRSLERATNIVVIITALLFCTTLAKNYWIGQRLQGRHTLGREVDRLQGQSLPIHGIDFSQSEKTVVLAISTQCHFCLHSIPFYQRLTNTDAVRTGKVAIVAVFPQDKAVAESFVKGSNIHINSVVSSDLPTIGISGTPTILLVRRSGKIEKAWVGELSATEQRDLIAQIEG
jgi:hypothetical protein